MVEVWLPYGESEIPARVQEERLGDIIKPDPPRKLSEPVEEAKKLIGTKEQFLQRARVANRTCLVVGQCGSKQTATALVWAVLQFIPDFSNKAVMVCIPESTEPDPNSLDGIRLVTHTDRSNVTKGPQTNSGFIPELDSQFVNADLRISIGELRPHHFLKYDGLSDLIFPGLASEASAHSQSSDRAGMTLEGIHNERVEIAQSFENLWALGLVLDDSLIPTTVRFGEFDACLNSLQPVVDECYSKQISKRTDIMIISPGGAPYDATLNRAVEAFPAGLTGLKKGGALIVAAECGRGYGGGQFYEWCSEHKEPRYLESRLRHRISYDGFKAAYFGRAVQNHRVYFVSTVPDHYVEDVFGMRPASTVNAALQTAQRALGSDSIVSVIPNASRVIVKQAQASTQ